MTKYVNHFKQRYLRFKLQLMLEVHVWQVYLVMSTHWWQK